MAKKIEHPEWFFAWMRPKGKEYITMLCGWSRQSVICMVEKDTGQPWSRIYKRGGRILKCSVKAVDRTAAKE